MNHYRSGRFVLIMLAATCAGATTSTEAPTTAPSDAPEPSPLPFPIYVASRIDGKVTIDGQLTEPAWRSTALGWGLSHSIEPNLLCPDATLFRIGWDDEGLLISLACYKREVQADIPDHVWKPREPELIDAQAVARHARERGVTPPVNTAEVLISRQGRTVTVTFAPPEAPTVSVHDTVGNHALDIKIQHAYQGGPKDGLWTVEARITWQQLGFERPGEGDNWALNVYRDIRFFSNWAFISWMRDWGKAEYSRYDLVERFGRIVFARGDAGAALDKLIAETVARRGPVRVFTSDSLLLAMPDGKAVRQRYGEQVHVMTEYAEGVLRQRQRISNDLPYHPFFSEKKPREHLAIAAQQLARLRWALQEKPPWDDPACTVALISHAIPEAREGLFSYKNERLYRGLFE
jgi:hypothetical protein